MDQPPLTKEQRKRLMELRARKARATDSVAPPVPESLLATPSPAPEQIEGDRSLHERARQNMERRIHAQKEARRAFNVGNLEKAQTLNQRSLDLDLEKNDRELWNFIMGNRESVPADILDLQQEYSSMSHGLEYDITQAKAMILRGEKDLRKEPGIVTPTPQTEIERKEVEEIQRLEEVIANAERVLEGNQVLEETLLRELAEIRGENVEIQTKSTEELEKELSALRAELEGTLAIRFMKRRGLKERISELDKKIINQIQLEEDRKQNPFKYYLIDKLHPTNFSILFHGNKEGISVKKINKTTGEDGRNLKFWDLKLITTETNNAISFSSNGFYLKLTNKEEVKNEEGISTDDPKARYELIDPDGLIKASDLDYQTATNLFWEKAREYQEQQVKLFNL